MVAPLYMMVGDDTHSNLDNILEWNRSERARKVECGEQRYYFAIWDG